MVMALSLVLTMSRSGMMAFVASLVITGWLVARVFDSRPQRIGAGICLAAVVVVVVGWAGPDVIASRFSSADWGEFNSRRGAWLDALGVTRDFPVAGTGANTYWAAALFYQRHELTHYFAQAHNDYLQVAAEGGLLLTLPALVCVTLFVRDVVRRMGDERGTTAWWLRAGAVTSLIAIALQESVDFSLQMPGNAALFAAVCAIALHRPPPTTRRTPSSPLRLVPQDGWSAGERPEPCH
jgi:O-antigen ligase